MTDADTPPPPPGHSHIPPPPPVERSGRGGCVKVGLIGCGALLVLAVLAVLAMMLWWRQNRGEIEAQAGTAAREGARFGLVSDEQACWDEAARRASGSATITGAFSVGAYMRACLEYSRPTPGFCDGVPPVTAIRRSVEWQQQRCGTNQGCRTVAQEVQTYCAEGRPKRPAGDTLRMERAAPAEAPGAPGG